MKSNLSFRHVQKSHAALWGIHGFLSGLIALSVMVALPSSQAAVTFTAISPSGDVALGDPVSVPIQVAGFADLTDVSFTLTWNSSVLALQAKPTGGPLSLGTGNFGTPSSGTLTFVWHSASGRDITPDGTTLFTAQFNTIGAGASPIAFANSPTEELVVFSNLSSETPNVVDGSVNVVPEPVNYALAGFGFLFLSVAVLRSIRWRQAVPTP